MSEPAITRRKSLGMLAGLAAIPFIGRAVRVPQDTFEISFHRLDEKVVIHGYADGMVDVHWREPWKISATDRGGWHHVSGPDKSFMALRYKPSDRTIEILGIQLRQQLLT